jgi:RHS repeat-associated protein
MLPKNLGNSILLSFVRSLFFTLSFMAVFFLGAGPLNLEALIKGDINNDGRVDIQDAVRSLRMHIGTEAVDLPKGDLNYDNLVNPTDADLILKMGLGLVTLPPDPGSVALPPDPTVATNLSAATSFLYTGPNPVQTGVTSGTIDAKRVAVIRGKVMTREGLPLSGVAVTILNHPEYGRTLTRDDGIFDLVVNGGGPLTVNYQKEGYLPAQRQVNAPWQDYVWAPDVVLVPLDTQVTTVDLSASSMQVARGSVQTDSDGIRQATLFFPQGTQAQLVMPDGSTRSITALNIRATEYTVGPNGPKAMPAELPPTSAYTYCVEFSADEALAAGAKGIQFNQPVIAYLENFIDLPAGLKVPVGYYDKEKGSWVPVPDGRVVKILAATGGMAELDTDGDNIVDNGIALGVTDAERRKLAEIYSVGQTLWRTTRTHFSTEDFNLAFVTTPDMWPPKRPAGKPGDGGKKDKPCKDSSWGCIEFQNQIFGETVAVTGTPFTLNYSSDRVSGYKAANTLEISLSDATVPTPLKRIDLEIMVAGRKFTQSFPPSPNQTYTFVWDGQDAYGRRLQGKQPVLYRIGYVYSALYGIPAGGSAASFGIPSGVVIPGTRFARLDYIQWQEETTFINLIDFRDLGLGGWSLSAHHQYDFQGRVLYYGDGKRRSIDNMNAVFGTYAGGGILLGDGGPATQAKLNYPRGITVGPDGSLYIADTGNRRVRKVTPDGTITTVAGNGGGSCFATDPCGDGGPALQAPVYPTDVAIGPDGSLFIADPGTDRIRKVGADGVITRVAGAITSSLIFNGDDIPALDAVIKPGDLEVAPDGTIYFSDSIRNTDNSYRVTVRRIGPDGIIHRYAGTGGDFNCPPYESCGDGGPAIDAILAPTDIALAPDGSLYIYADNTYTVRRVGPDGIINTVAGKYDDQTGMADGVPATETHFYGWGIALDRKGLLHIGESGWWDWGPSGRPVRVPSYRVRRVGNDQIIATVAGGANDNSYSIADENGPAIGAHFHPYRIALGPDGSLYISDLTQSRVSKVHSVFKGFDLGNILIASEDGNLLYQFDPTGRHLKTINTLTGATVYTFGYDSGRLLVTITDGDGNVTTIERDGNGNPTGILGPYGQHTALTLNANGYLASVTNPASETTQLGYGNEGLLTSVTGPRGSGFTDTMVYDALGRLASAHDSAGGSSTLTRTDLTNGHQVGVTTAMGRTSSYLSETLATGVKHNRNTFQDGTVAESNTGTDGISTTTLPDGTTTTSVPGPDPRFGMQAPLAKNSSVATGGQTSNTANSRSVILTDPNDPLILTSMTDTSIVNTRTFTTTYNAAARTFTATSPMGRQMSFTIDTQGRIAGSQVPGLEATNYGYDTHGRLNNITTGSSGNLRVSNVAYGSNGYVAGITNPLNQTGQFSYDLAGRITQQTFPDTRQVQYGYDGHGNMTSLITPRGHSHTFGHSPVDLVSSYTAPGPTTTSYTYNNDRKPTRVTRPEGTYLDFGYDTSGRLATLTLPGGGQIARAYNGTTGQLSTMTATDGGTLTFGYSGGLPTSETWAGSVAGSLSRTYSNNFRLSYRSINGGNTISYQYDDDGLLIGAGDLTLTRDAQNGLLTGSTVGSVTDAWTYNGFAEPTSYIANYSGPIYSVLYNTYDKLGRITQKTETILGGSSDIYEYEYDLAGRLEKVKKNTTTIFTYTYDANGNRLSYSSGGPPVTGTYDNQDRLLTYGTATYQYTANGELQSKTTGGQTTTYQYDALGNLLSVILPNTTQIVYLVDGGNKRIGKKVNNTLVKGFLYDGQLNPVAELDGNNQLVSHFIFGSRVNVPDYLVKGGVTYRIVSDHLGSPRLVVNTATGAIAQRMDYDEFGRVTNDTFPGFQPFGFAGGLYDSETGLVRFGARDYDAGSGRWITKDPIQFRGGQVNLYTYINNNPINNIDPLGLDPNWNRIGTGIKQFGSGLGGAIINAAIIEATGGKSYTSFISLTNSLINAGVGGGNIVNGFLYPNEPTIKTPTEFMICQEDARIKRITEQELQAYKEHGYNPSVLLHYTMLMGGKE